MMTEPSKRYRKTPRPVLQLDTGEAASRLAIGLLALVHLVIAMSLILVIAATAARAETDGPANAAACPGIDLTEVMARDEPALFDDIQQEAERTPNGDGLLWRVTKNGARSWLFGTMHSADPTVHALSAETRAALDDAATLVIESEEILDPEKAQAALLTRPDLTMFTDGTTLQSLMSEDDYATVAAHLEERGMPVAAISHMKPWMLSGLLATSECEAIWRAEGGELLDIALARRFEDAGKPVAGLETIEEQLSAMASLPLDFHVRGLIETVELGPMLDDVTATMAALYADGRIGMIMPVLRAAGGTSDEGDADGYAAFEETIVTERNHVMAERATSYLDEGDAFIAVGALHLPGEEGLVALLEARGYTVEPAD